MDRERLDLIIDRQLRSAMAVTPSVDFTARVREQLVHERRAPSWWGWPALAAASIAVVVVSMALLFKPSPVRTDQEARVPGAARQQLAASPVERVAPAVPRVGTIVPKKRHRVNDVEVIVPRGQLEAIHRFAESLSVSVRTPTGRPLPMLVVLDENHLPEVPSYDPKWSKR